MEQAGGKQAGAAVAFHAELRARRGQGIWITCFLPIPAQWQFSPNPRKGYGRPAQPRRGPRCNAGGALAAVCFSNWHVRACPEMGLVTSVHLVLRQPPFSDEFPEASHHG